MPKLPLALGLDVSTTASKAICIDVNGSVHGHAAIEHKSIHPHPQWSEQDPEAWWYAMCQSIKTVLSFPSVDASSIHAIGLTGQMHGLVLLDSSGSVLRPAILWNDGRASRQCEEIRQQIGLERLVGITGNDAFTGFTAPKLLWVRDHEPDCYQKIAQILLPKDYIRWKLSGIYATDQAGAGGTLLLDLSTRTWSTHLLQELDISEDWLPPTHEGTQCTGTISSEGARDTGLIEGTPIYAGGGDQAAQAISVGAIHPDTWAITLGTSGVVFAPTDTPRVDSLGRAHAFPHAIPGMWHMMGVMLSAAGSLEWYRNIQVHNISYKKLFHEATQIEPGSEGLFFLPYLSGERTPHADPYVRGSFIGLTPTHRRAHLTRALLEGVGYGLRDNLHLLFNTGLPTPEQILISGGGAKSSVWCQILADIIGHSLSFGTTIEGAAAGAALLAGTGVGIWDSIEEACIHTGTITNHVEPGENAIIYSELHEKFKELYQRLNGFDHA